MGSAWLSVCGCRTANKFGLITADTSSADPDHALSSVAALTSGYARTALPQSQAQTSNRVYLPLPHRITPHEHPFTRSPVRPQLRYFRVGELVGLAGFQLSTCESGMGHCRALPLRRGIDTLEGCMRRSEVDRSGAARLLPRDGCTCVVIFEMMSYARPPDWGRLGVGVRVGVRVRIRGRSKGSE